MNDQPAEPANVSPETPTAPVPWFRKRRNQAIGAVAVLVAAGVAVGLPVTGAGPGTITVHGTLSIGGMANDTGSDPFSPVDGDPCYGIGGYSDITAGKTVTISGGTGQVLATTGLSSGVETDLPANASIATSNCVFSFSAQVPAGQSAYTIAVSGRGSQTFTPAQAQAGVALSLG